MWETEREQDIMSHRADWPRVTAGLKRGCRKNYSWEQSEAERFQSCKTLPSVPQIQTQRNVDRLNVGGGEVIQQVE